MAPKVPKWCKELIQIIKLKIDQLYPTLKNARKARPQNGQKGPKKIFFHNKHVIEWARNLENINIFLMAAHPSHPQSLKKQNPNFSFFSKTHLALDRFCKIKLLTAKMASKTFINDSDMLNILQIIDFQQKIIGLDFMYHRIVKSWPHGLLNSLYSAFW